MRCFHFLCCITNTSSVICFANDTFPSRGRLWGLLQADAGVYILINHIRKEIDKQDKGAYQHDDGKHHGIIAIAYAHNEHSSYAGNGENLLYNNTARNNIRQSDGKEGYNGKHGISKYMAPEYARGAAAPAFVRGVTAPAQTAKRVLGLRPAGDWRAA